jgi:ribosomal protein L33, bacterial type
MAWQKNKILLVSVTTDSNGRKVVYRYLTNKSKGGGKAKGNLAPLKLKKYNPKTNSHTVFIETKYK